MVAALVKRALTALAALAVPATAWAGPPYLTDDPEPTDTGHWEIYGPLVSGSGTGSDMSGWTGAEINYGAAKDVQVTLDLPLAFAHDAGGWSAGACDLAASVKYRFLNDEKHGIQAAFFPAIAIPTATRGLGAGRVTGLLPVWLQKDSGAWSVFGGGGYAINPGAGNRNYWTGGVAATRQVTHRLSVGVEADRQGPDTVGGASTTSLGMGAIWQLKGPFRLLASGGPSLPDGGGPAGYHFYLALGLDY